MRFHGVVMTGPFVNQKLTTLPTFDTVRDQGRLVWLTNGTLWYGSDIEWVSFGGSGTGDASETEDMYSDLLRTTIFLNASWDGFENINFINSTNMTYNEKYTRLEYTNGQYVESKNLFDVLSYATYVDYVMVYVDYIGNSVGQVEVSSNGGTNWSVVHNNKIFRIDNAFVGTDLRVRFTGLGTGVVNSLGVLYNKDLTAACTKYGLTYGRFVATAGQTLFIYDYIPGAIQVFLNGELLDGTDYTATTGYDITINQPLQAGDIVYIISYSTSILNPDMDFSDFIRHDGTVDFTADQSMGSHKLTSLSNGTSLTDAVNLGQLNGKESSLGNPTSDGMVLSSTVAGIRSWENVLNGPIITSSVSITGNIIGGNITKTDANQLTIQPISCLDSTGVVPLYTLSAQSLSIPSSIINQVYHIFVVRLVSDGSMTFRSYTTEAAAASDATINAYRWICFWNTTPSGTCYPGVLRDNLLAFGGPEIMGGNNGVFLSGFFPGSGTWGGTLIPPPPDKTNGGVQVTSELSVHGEGETGAGNYWLIDISSFFPLSRINKLFPWVHYWLTDHINGYVAVDILECIAPTDYSMGGFMQGTQLIVSITAYWGTTTHAIAFVKSMEILR